MKKNRILDTHVILIEFHSFSFLRSCLSVLRRNFVVEAHLFFFSRWEIKTCVLLCESDQWIFLLLSSAKERNRGKKTKKLSQKLLKLRNLLMKFSSLIEKLKQRRALTSTLSRLSHDADLSCLRSLFRLPFGHKLLHQLASYSLILPHLLFGFLFQTLDNLNPKESVGTSTSCTTFRSKENSRREARENENK